LLPNLNPTDGLILLLYLFCVVAVGFSLRLNIKTSKDYFQAGRALPVVICAIAFVAASLGLPEIIGMGAAGAQFGLRAALYFSLGAIPALLFAGLYMMPLYYGSGARTVPEYLGLRFDLKTRLLNAGTFAGMTLVGGGISLYLMARIFQALHVFDPLFYAYGWPQEGIFTVCVLLSAALVLVYLLFGGLAGAMVNQALQFLIIVASFLPLAILGLRDAGGFGSVRDLAGLSVPLAAAFPHCTFLMRPVPAALLSLTLGFVLGAGRWCTDFRLLQNAMAVKNVESARRIPLIAAAARLFLPLLLILPGAIAIGLPTPHSTTVVHDENGAIFHEITVVPPEQAQGHGLVPARVDPVSSSPLLDSAGHVLLNFDRATPAMLVHFLPVGLLGLGLAALLAGLMSGLAAGIAALSAVVTNDIYRSSIRKDASEGRYVAVGRWTVVGGILISVGMAYAVSGAKGDALAHILYPLLLSFALVTATQLATFLLGMFWTRATSHGAFVGLAAGTVAALLHQGLTLPLDAHAGLAGGWIAVMHRYPGFIAQCFWTAVAGFAVNAIVTVAVSLYTEAKTKAELKGLVHSLIPKPKKVVAGSNRPEAIAAIILLAAVVLGLFFV
jgi:SSS family solute:Na+ symporter